MDDEMYKKWRKKNINGFESLFFVYQLLKNMFVGKLIFRRKVMLMVKCCNNFSCFFFYGQLMIYCGNCF